MKLIVFIIISCFTNKGLAQVILNGDFEINFSVTCEFNLSNSQYTNQMQYSWGFGTSNELDIQTSPCGYANVPSKQWFVSLSKHINGDYDQLSLKLSSGLVPGSSYQISYFEFGSSDFSNNNVPLQIGLSIDSLSFGQTIYNSLPVMNIWTQRTFTFIAPNNGQFITVRIDSAGVTKGWDFIDNMQLEISNGINNSEFGNNEIINIYPNPANDKIILESPVVIKEIFLTITDIQGVKILNYNYINQNIVQLNISMLHKGIYFLKIKTEQSFETKKIIIQ